MRYFGGKQRISKDLCLFLNKEMKDKSLSVFVDAFCGSCNVSSKINSEYKICNDINEYLIEMFIALQNEWEPPNVVTEELYRYTKENKNINKPLTSFIGFGCSFAGKFFGGYARSSDRNYAKNAKNSLKKKMKNLSVNTSFTNHSYELIDAPDNSLIYCDIPYKNTTKYSTGDFEHDSFYKWAKSKDYVYISEYKHNVPDDGVIVWEKESKKDIRDKNGIRKKTIEVVFRFE